MEFGVLPDSPDEQGSIRQIPKHRLVGVAAIAGHHQAPMPGVMAIVHLVPKLPDLIAPAGGQVVLGASLAIGLFLRRAGGRFGLGDGWMMLESHRHPARRSGRRTRRDQGRELNKALPRHQVHVEGWRHRITPIADPGNLPAGLGQSGIVQCRHQRRGVRQHVQRPADHGGEQIGHLPLVAGKQAVVRRPVLVLPSPGADQPGEGVSSQTGELTQAEPAGPFPSAMLPKGADAFRPEGIEFAQEG